jgi:hypothetical protein
MPKHRPRPSQTWRTFLANHVQDLVSIDFFTVPTARLRVLFVLVVLAHHRRRVVHFNVTEHPTAAWTAQQLVDAFPDESAPPYLLRDRDQVYGQQFRHRVTGMGIEEVLTAPQNPWQNPFAERAHRLDPARVPESRARPRRATPPPHPDPLSRLLPSVAHPPCAGQGRTRPQADRAPRDGEDRAASRSRWPASPLRPPSGIVQHRPSSLHHRTRATAPEQPAPRARRSRIRCHQAESADLRTPSVLPRTRHTALARASRRLPGEPDEVLAKDSLLSQ